MIHFPPLCIILLAVLIPSGLRAGGSEANFITELGEGRRQKIVVYGTSLTANSAWPAQLQSTLREAYGRKLDVVNAARGGADSRWGLANVTRRVVREKPDSVLIEFAINDALESSKLSVSESIRNLEGMIEIIRRERPACEVILMIMNPPVGDALAQRPHIADYEKAYRRAAREIPCRLIDFSGVWRPIISKQSGRWIALAPDGLHPNGKACREVILPGLLKGIGFPQPSHPPNSGS